MAVKILSAAIFVLWCLATYFCAARPPLPRAASRRTSLTWNGLTAVTKVHGRQHLRDQTLRRLLTSSVGPFITADCDSTCQKDQQAALKELYEVWDGPSWSRQANWNNEDVSLCHWEGVLCCLLDSPDLGAADDLILPGTDDPPCPENSTGVVALTLSGNNLTGDLAAVRWEAFGSTLRLLELDNNELFGSSSEWSASGGLGSLVNLSFLSLGTNRLSGPLDPFATLPNIRALLLHTNRVEGTLPEALVTHPTLEYLDLDRNQLKGSLPAGTFTGANRLRDLHLAHNDLSGTFPEASSNNSLPGRMDYLDVSHNRLAGPLPRYLSRIVLTYLDASANGLSGRVAPLLQTSWSLYHLDLGNNSLTGPIPTDMRCRHVQYLDLSTNQLNGTLPPSIGGLYDIIELRLNGNPDLHGELPVRVGTPEVLKLIDIRDTQMQAREPGPAGMPDYVNLTKELHSTGPSPAYPLCPQALLHGSLPIGISPFYWQYGNCRCQDGFTANYTRSPSAGGGGGGVAGNASDGAVVGLTCAAVVDGGDGGGGQPRVPWWAVVVIVVGGVGALALALLMVYRLMPSVVRYRTMLAKRMPPGFTRRARGCVVTLVLTDVEGSTELWEWDTDLMAAAIDLHDHTLRSQMSKWYGYEVQTEGDAFLMAFHEPADAVGWCVTTQLALLNADWDRELFRHHKACIETMESLQPLGASDPTSIQLPRLSDVPQSLVGAGGGHSGAAGGSAANGGAGGAGLSSVLPSLDLGGGIPGRGMGSVLSALPAGILLGSQLGGNSGMSSARGLTPQRLSASGVEDQAAPAGPQPGEGGGGQAGYELGTGGTAGGASGSAAGGGGAGGGGAGGGGWGGPDASRPPPPPESTKVHAGGLSAYERGRSGSGIANATEFADWTRYTRLNVLYRGLRVRMGVATGVTDAITSHAITQRMEYSGEVYRRVQAVADLPHGGQVLLDTSTFNAIHNNLNDLGVRAVQLLTQDRRSANGVAVVGSVIGGGCHNSGRPSLASLLGGVTSLDRKRNRQQRQSLELASAPEAAEAAEPPAAPPSVLLSRTEVLDPASTMQAKEDGYSGAAIVGGGDGRGAPGGGVAMGRTTLTSTSGWIARRSMASHSLLWRVASGLGRSSGTAVAGAGAATFPRQRTGSEGIARSPSAAPQCATLPHVHFAHLSSDNNPSAGAGTNHAPVNGQPQTSPNAVFPHPNHQHHRPIAPQPSADGAPGTPGIFGQASTAAAAAAATAAAPAAPAAGGGGSGYSPPVSGVLPPGLPPLPNGSPPSGVCLSPPQLQSPPPPPVVAPLVRVSLESSGRDGTAHGIPGRRPGPGGFLRGPGGVGIGMAGSGPRGMSLEVPGSASEADQESVLHFGTPAREPRVGHLREVPLGPMSQATPATRATAALNELAREAIQRRSSIAPAISVVNMGVFELNAGSSVEYVNVTQVLVPGLEERARLGKTMEASHQLTPGYFDAPATLVAPLGWGLRGQGGHRAKFPLVTLVFCSMERYSDMLAINRDLSQDVMDSYNDCVRRSLLACNGYECQEQEGNFMIAFARPAEALEWCLMLQELMMEVPWTPAMLRLPSMQEELHPLTGAVLFRGPRVKSGVYEGVPTRVSPHSTTGRADYFGPLVNRAARYCHAAAQGGQIIVSRSLVEEVLRELLRTDPAGLPAADQLPAESLPVQLLAPVDNSGVVPSRWRMPQDIASGREGAVRSGSGGGAAGMAALHSGAVAGGGSAGPGTAGPGSGGGVPAAGRRASMRNFVVKSSRVAPPSPSGTDTGTSRIGSIMVLPEFPFRSDGAPRAGVAMRTASRRGRSVAPDSTAHAADGMTQAAAAAPTNMGPGGESNGGGDRVTTDDTPSLLEAPAAGAATAGNIPTASGRRPLLIEDSCPFSSMPSGPSFSSAAASAAAAAAAMVTEQSQAPSVVGVVGGGGDSNGGESFVAVEVPLSELASYDISPSSVPRRMRPAVESALAEARRAAAVQRRDRIQIQGAMGAPYTSGLLSSRPASSRRNGSLAAAVMAAAAATAAAATAPPSAAWTTAEIATGVIPPSGSGLERGMGPSTATFPRSEVAVPATAASGGSITPPAASGPQPPLLLQPVPPPRPPPGSYTAPPPPALPYSVTSSPQLQLQAPLPRHSRGSEPCYLDIGMLQQQQQQPPSQPPQGHRRPQSQQQQHEQLLRLIADRMAHPSPLEPQQRTLPAAPESRVSSVEIKHLYGPPSLPYGWQQTPAAAAQLGPSTSGNGRAPAGPSVAPAAQATAQVPPPSAGKEREVMVQQQQQQQQPPVMLQWRQPQAQPQPGPSGAAQGPPPGSSSQAPGPAPGAGRQPQPQHPHHAPPQPGSSLEIFQMAPLHFAPPQLLQRYTGGGYSLVPPTAGTATPPRAGGPASASAPAPLIPSVGPLRHPSSRRGQLSALVAAYTAVGSGMAGSGGGGGGPAPGTSPAGAMPDAAVSTAGAAATATQPPMSRPHHMQLQSMESIPLTYENSAAFNALWEIATDEVAGGVSGLGGWGGGASSSRLDVETAAALLQRERDREVEALETEMRAAAAMESGTGINRGDGAGGWARRGSAGSATDQPRLPAALRGGPSLRAKRRGSFLVMDSTPGCLPTLPEGCIRSRTGALKWLWAHELLVEDLGQFRFKGVAGDHSIVSVSTAGISERKLGSRVKKSKGERVQPGRGLLYRVMLKPVNPTLAPDAALLQAALMSEGDAGPGPAATGATPGASDQPPGAYRIAPGSASVASRYPYSVAASEPAPPAPRTQP